MKFNLQSIISMIGAECAKQRKTLFLWAPVMVGIGIVLYFTSGLDVGSRAIAIAIVTSATGMIYAWRSYSSKGHIRALFVLLLFTALALVGVGYGLAKYRTDSLNTLILEKDLPVLEVTATIENLVMLDGGKAKRVILKDIIFDDADFSKWNGLRARLQTYHFKGDEWAMGDKIRVKTKLRAPSKPVMPEGFDFRFKAYFDGLGAVGYTLSDATLLVKNDAKIDHIAQFRSKIGSHLYQFLTPETAGVAQALLTGERAGIRKQDTEAMRVSGLAHLLAISGLHVGLVAGCVFFFVRLFLATIPNLALYYPIKKWAAACAILVAFSYMILAGATVPTVRAFIMTSLVLFAIILDRSALNMRLVALAALVVMVMTPEKVIGPSFVLSFSAVAALIVFYQSVGRRWLVNANAYKPYWRPIYYLVGVIATTTIATLATAPFAILFFNKFSVYSVLSNILAMPIMSFVVMPIGLLATLLIPFGIDGHVWPLMGWGIEQIIIIAHATSSYTGASLYWSSLNQIETIWICVGFLWLILWQGWMRWFGLVCMIGALFTSYAFGQKQIMISEDMKAIMIVDNSEDKIYLIGKAGKYLRKNWLNSLGYNEAVNIPTYESGDNPALTDLVCDDFRCQLRGDDTTIDILTNPLGLYDSCQNATILIADIPVDDDECENPAVIIDRFNIWRDGATTITLSKGGYDIQSVNNAQNKDD